MILSEFAIILANTMRSKAYLQLLIQNSLLPSCCYLLTESIEDLNFQPFRIPQNDYHINKYFNIDENIINTICNNNIPYEVMGTTDINSKKALDILASTNEKYLIYSGYGGCILGTELFQIDKKWIHIHAGILPDYRGSTTAYYSILKDNMIGATAIFMNERIDEGSIIGFESYPIPQPYVNIDYIYEPYIRATLLVKILKDYLKTGRFICSQQDQTKAETYYIIHPLLKHIAILSIEDKNGLDLDIDTSEKGYP